MKTEIRNRLFVWIFVGCFAFVSAPTLSAVATNEMGPRCGDGVDNDGDTLIDEADPEDCGNCTNGIDDDGDGLADCEDPNCCGETACILQTCRGSLSDCVGGICLGADTCVNTGGNIADGTTCDDNDACTGVDECDGNGSCVGETEVCCDNNVNDDSGVDGDTDCDDSDCPGVDGCPICGDNTCDTGEDSCSCPDDCGSPPGTEAGSCDDNIDNDCGGGTDCDDSDCYGDAVCCGDGNCDGVETACDCVDDCGSPPTTETGSCSDNLDNDCDGCQDGEDVDCSGTETVCDDNTDNDCDNDTDCDDIDCASASNCLTCGDNSCDGGEDQCSCAADCGSPPSDETGLCDDNIDNDCGGGTDCDDTDCHGDSACCGDGNCDTVETQCTCPADCGSPPPAETGQCDDNVDNDCGGGTDCADADCLLDAACAQCGDQSCTGNETACTCPQDCGTPPTTETGLCDDNVDNDCTDGADCQDPDCVSDQACILPENCFNGKDEDGDTKIDCEDPDCDGVTCDDGVDCTVNDLCRNGTCSGIRNNTFCSDGNFCSGDETCSPASPQADARGCLGGAAPCDALGTGCDEANDLCIETACFDGINNDGDTGKDCLDLDCPCPVGSICNRNIAECEETNCADGLDNDRDGLVDCRDPNCNNLPCTDGVACTDDSNLRCTGGVCPVGQPRDSFCDDGVFCNGRESCVPGAFGDGCVSGSDPCPGPGNDCNENKRRCVETACTDGLDNDSDNAVDCLDGNCPCPDGQACNPFVNPPVCVEFACGDGQDNDGDDLVDCADPDCRDRPCSDIYACTDDSNARCSANRICEGSVPDHLSCDDGDPCTGEERCRGATGDANGCVSGINRPCATPSGQACVNENGVAVCHEVECSDGQDNDGQGGVDCNDPDCLCPDGTSCRADGGCPELDCTNGIDDDGDLLTDCADPDCINRPCDDGIECTLNDRCLRHPDTGVRVCGGDPSDLSCDDLASCTSDQCAPESLLADPLTGCVNAPNGSVCADSFSCTRDRCAPEEAGAAQGTGCVNEPQHDVCDNGQFCDGTERCDPRDLAQNPDARGCTNPGNPCVDPGESCNDAEDRCVELECRDSIDNDSDGDVDCGDSDCPEATDEDCSDQFDNDCDGLIDCADQVDCLRDLDGDGHFDEPCGQDCNDGNPEVNPGRTEDCTSPEDDDCDGRLNCDDEDDCRFDLDQDGHLAPPCGADCDDSNRSVFPGALEICGDGLDNDCDGLVDCEDDRDCGGVVCNDGFDCTANDVCTNGICAGTPRDFLCEDNRACTLDSCEPGFGCVNEPDDAACNNGLFCDGLESCVPGSPLADSNGCVDGEDPCAEGLACDERVDTCECPTDPFESDNTCAEAREIVVDQALRSEQHTLCPEGDMDRVEFDVVAGTEYTFFTTGGVDTLGILTTANCGTELARNNDCGISDRNFCIQWTAGFTGRAVLTVQAGDAPDPKKEPAEGPAGSDLVGNGPRGALQTGDFSSLLADEEPVVLEASGPYTLFFQAATDACIPELTEPGNGDCATVPQITPTETPVTEDHTLCPTGDIDGWRFLGGEGITYRFASLGGTDTKVQIRSDDCTDVLVKADDCNGDPNFCIEFTPQITAFYKVVVLGQNPQVTGPYRFRYQRLGDGGPCLPDGIQDDACSEAVFISVGPAEQSESRTLCEEGDVDTFRFQAQAGKVYRFQTSGGLDTRLILGSDNCGQTLADETTCGLNPADACILWEAPSDGFYKLRVQGRISAVTGPYQLLHQQETCPKDGYEPDDSCGQARTIVVDSSLKRQAHTICPASEIDLYQFFGVAGETYRFYSEGPTDMGGAVLTSTCKFLVKDESNGPGGENFDLRFTPRESGFYKLGVTGDGGPYDLYYQTVSDPGTGCIEDGAEDDDTCEQGTPIVPELGEQMLARTLCPTDDRDHFTFQAVEGVTYFFWTEGDVDTVGTVRGPDCSQLKRNDDRDLPDDLNFYIEWTAPASGEAHVRVRGFNRNLTVGPYTFHYQLAP